MREKQTQGSDPLNIKAIRRQRGLKQSDLAAKLGCGRSAIAKWETGKASPRADTLPQLAKALGCTLNDLFSDAPY
jgi:transcriptional regulator with XRE-family HTH domain